MVCVKCYFLSYVMRTEKHKKDKDLDCASVVCVCYFFIFFSSFYHKKHSYMLKMKRLKKKNRMEIRLAKRCIIMGKQRF